MALAANAPRPFGECALQNLQRRAYETFAGGSLFSVGPAPNPRRWDYFGILTFAAIAVAAWLLDKGLVVMLRV